MNSTLSLLVSVATFAVASALFLVWAYNHWLGIGDPAVSPNPKQKEKNAFGILMTVFFLSFAGCLFAYIVTNGHDATSSLKKQETTPVLVANPAPVPPTPHETAVQKQIEQELRDVHKRQMALSVAQEAALTADREHIAKQREQELKAEKLNSKLAAFERFTEQSAKTAESGLKLLEKISKQEPAKVINIITNPPQVIYATSAPPNITIVATNNNHATFTFTNVNNVAVSNHNPIVVQPPGVVIQPVPVTLTLTSTATVSSGASTQAVVAPKPAPAPAVTNAPSAPKASARAKAPKALVAPAVAPTNALPAKAAVAKAPPAKAGRGVVTHTEDPGKISRGAKDWWVINLFTGTPETIQRKFTLRFEEAAQSSDRSVAQAALDLFCSHRAKELRKKATPDNLQGMFEEFVRKNPNLSVDEKSPRKIGEVLGMQPKVTSEILPGGTPGT